SRGGFLRYWVRHPKPDTLWALDNDSFLLAKRYILQPALLDQTLVPAAFDALVELGIQRRKQQLNPPLPVVDEGESEFSQFSVRIDGGTNTSQNTILLHIFTYAGDFVQLTFNRGV